jgi:hypothetical protein
MANTPFDYILSITGDCASTGVGAISVLFTGGTPPYTVQWTDPNLGIDYVTTQPSKRENLYPNTYAISVQDSELPDNQRFILNVPVSAGVCVTVTSIFSTTCGNDNGSVIATSTSNFSSTYFALYDYSGNTIQSAITNSAEVEFVGLSAGTYSIGVEDLGGCTGLTQNFIIEDSSPVDFGFYLVPNSSCNPDIDLGKIYITGVTGTPPYTYLWAGGQTGSTLTGLTSGIYSVTVTDSNSCSTTKTTPLTDVDPLGFGFFSAITPSCFSNDGAIILTITGGTAPYYYSASTGDVEISYSQEFTLSGISSGFYSFTITDAALCKQTFGTELLSPKSIGTVNISSSNSSCSSNDGSITVTVTQGSPPYSYTLVYPDTSTDTVATDQSTYTFDNLETGNYSVNVTDLTSCSYSENISIVATNLFTLSVQATGTTCSLDNGTIQVTKSTGGTEPFTYSLDGVIVYPSTSLSAVTFTDVPAGQHTITVSDFTGCTQIQSIVVNTSAPLDFELYGIGCGSGNEGTITAFISSGQSPFTFDWSDNVPSNPQQISVSGLTAGTYSLIIVDANNCTLQRDIVISCNSVFSSYQIYNMASESLEKTTQSDFGLLQMLNDGFNDLANENVGCQLVSATFVAEVSTSPEGYSATSAFYTGYTLNDVPADNLWYDTVKSLLLQIPGILSVIVDPLTNEISIQTNPTNTIISNEVINIDLKIVYNIDCQE